MSIKGILFLKPFKANMVSIQTEIRRFDLLTCCNSIEKRESRHIGYFLFLLSLDKNQVKVFFVYYCRNRRKMQERRYSI